MECIKILTMILILIPILAFANALAAEPGSDEMDAAEKLWQIGLFHGVGNPDDEPPNFALDKNTTRIHGLVLLINFIGGDENEITGDNGTPYDDLEDWMHPYIAYAQNMKYLAGENETGFDPHSRMSAAHFLTLALRMLGYESGIDFQWNKAWELSDDLGLTFGEFNSDNNRIARGDMAVICLRMLSTAMRGSDMTLLDMLTDAGVFDNLADKGLIRDQDLLDAINSGNKDKIRDAIDKIINGNDCDCCKEKEDSSGTDDNAGNGTAPGTDTPSDNGNKPDDNKQQDDGNNPDDNDDPDGVKDPGDGNDPDNDKEPDDCDCSDNCNCPEYCGSPDCPKCDPGDDYNSEDGCVNPDCPDCKDKCCDNGCNENDCENPGDCNNPDCPDCEDNCDCSDCTDSGDCTGNNDCGCPDCKDTGGCTDNDDCSCSDCKDSDDCTCEDNCDCSDCTDSGGCTGNNDCDCPDCKDTGGCTGNDDCGCSDCTDNGGGSGNDNGCDNPGGCNNPDCSDCNPEQEPEQECTNPDCDNPGCKDPDCTNPGTWPKSLLNVTNDGVAINSTSTAEWVKVTYIDELPKGSNGETVYTDAIKTTSCYMHQQNRWMYDFDRTGVYHTLSFTAYNTTEYIARLQIFDYDTGFLLWSVNLAAGASLLVEDVNISKTSRIEFTAELVNAPTSATHYKDAIYLCDPRVDRGTKFNAANPNSFLSATDYGNRTTVGNSSRWLKVVNRDEMPDNLYGDVPYTEALKTDFLYMQQSTRVIYTLDEDGFYKTLSFTVYNQSPYTANIRIADVAASETLWEITLLPGTSQKVTGIDISNSTRLEFFANLTNSPIALTNYYNAIYICDPVVGFDDAVNIGDEPCDCGDCPGCGDGGSGGETCDCEEHTCSDCGGGGSGGETCGCGEHVCLDCGNCGKGTEHCDCGDCPGCGNGDSSLHDKCFFCYGPERCSICKTCMICDDCRHCTDCNNRIWHAFIEYDPEFGLSGAIPPELIGDGTWEDIIEWLSNEHNHIICYGNKCSSCSGRQGTVADIIIKDWHEHTYSNGLSVCLRTIVCLHCGSAAYKEAQIHDFDDGGCCVDCGAMKS